MNPPADYITLDKNLLKIVLDSKNPANKGIYYFTVGVQPTYPSIGVSSSRQFKVTLIDPCDTATVIDKKVGNLEVAKQSNEYFQTQVLMWSSFTYNPLEQYHVDCGKLQTKFYLKGTQ